MFLYALGTRFCPQGFFLVSPLGPYSLQREAPDCFIDVFSRELHKLLDSAKLERQFRVERGWKHLKTGLPLKKMMSWNYILSGLLHVCHKEPIAVLTKPVI